MANICNSLRTNTTRHSLAFSPIGRMTIVVTIQPNSFAIETKKLETAMDATKIGLSTTLFGGGYIVYSSSKIREELEKLEQEFWNKIENTISILTLPKG